MPELGEPDPKFGGTGPSSFMTAGSPRQVGGNNELLCYGMLCKNSKIAPSPPQSSHRSSAVVFKYFALSIAPPMEAALSDPASNMSNLVLQFLCILPLLAVGIAAGCWEHLTLEQALVAVALPAACAWRLELSSGSQFWAAFSLRVGALVCLANFGAHAGKRPPRLIGPHPMPTSSIVQ